MYRNRFNHEEVRLGNIHDHLSRLFVNTRVLVRISFLFYNTIYIVFSLYTYLKMSSINIVIYDEDKHLNVLKIY